MLLTNFLIKSSTSDVLAPSTIHGIDLIDTQLNYPEILFAVSPPENNEICTICSINYFNNLLNPYNNIRTTTFCVRESFNAVI